MARIKANQSVQTALTAIQGRILIAEPQNEDGSLVYGVSPRERR
jgi:hypothetical protein